MTVDFLGKTTACASRRLLRHTLRGRVFEAFRGARESTKGRQSRAAVLPEFTRGGRRCSGG